MEKNTTKVRQLSQTHWNKDLKSGCSGIGYGKNTTINYRQVQAKDIKIGREFSEPKAQNLKPAHEKKQEEIDDLKRTLNMLKQNQLEVFAAGNQTK